jgi:flagellar hook-basal body complex protein FliE
MTINTIDPTFSIGGPVSAEPASVQTQPVEGFADAMEKAINGVDELQKEANRSIQALADGSVQDIHQTMIAMEKASVSFSLVMEVRNKVVEAYQEIMRMQV